MSHRYRLAIISLCLTACTVHGTYVPNAQLHGAPISATTSTCEQQCRTSWPVEDPRYRSCFASCPDVVFLKDGVCKEANQLMCVPATRVNKPVFAIVASAVTVVLLGAIVLIGLSSLPGYSD